MKNRNRKRRSQIWLMEKNEFEKLVKSKGSIADILRHFNFAVTGRGNKMIQQRCSEEDIDISHIPIGINSNKNRKFKTDKTLIQEMLTEQSTFSRKYIKRRIIEEHIIDYKCSKCSIIDEWEGEKLVLILDHINGIRNDYRIENLRFLCPNCNSQTETFSGKNNKKSRLKQGFESP